ncbi:hypothetical protein [uncultured Thiodictyon sp.]|uniref:hypothetical protein n=1 Tax=uncultured Thiodictyon sp. TaxID=1846217 RepID=UPI0025FC3286|nr:hypothetical protein [uncultured Thiodictyon sp.]
MTDVRVVESGMVFGPFPSEDCWEIEHSACYLEISQGVQIAEFVRIEHRRKRPPLIWTVEAKTGSPNPAVKQDDFDKFIGKICAKLTNTMMLAVATCLGRHPDYKYELPTSFKVLDLAKADFRLVLVIKGDPNPFPDAWLPPIKDALALSLQPLVNTWRLSPTAVMVFNQALAKQYGLIMD